MDEILIKACGVTYRKGQYITGVGRSTLELMKALSKINNLPFKLYYYTTGLRANNMDRTDIDFQYFKIPFPDKIIHITELDVLYRKYILRPNLVHIPHNYDDSYKEENLLLTIHDVWGYKNITNKKEKKKWERAVYNASCIVTCSQYSKSMIEETFNLPCSKVVSIPWGISSDFNKVSPAILSECKTRLNLPSRYFLSVSCSHPRKNIETLIKAVKDYITITNRRVTFEYILLDNVNDKDIDAKNLAKLLKGINCYVNLIPYNESSNFTLKRSKTSQINRFYDILKKEGINVTIRKEFGSNISAACGQLRSKKEEQK